MRNVLIISDGDDMAGVNFQIKLAFDKHSTKYRLRQVRGTDNYIHYPADLAWMGNNTLVNDLYHKADLIHISEYPWALDGGAAPKIWEKVKKPTVIHQHGTPFRNNPKTFLDIARKEGYTQIVSTVDLLVDDSLTWVPNPVDIDKMRAIRRENYERLQPVDLPRRIIIGHGPTNRAIKNTAEYLTAVKDIGTDYLIIEGLPWNQALREKARCDIWYDQLTFGYGNNGIEAGSMGIPVVGGFSDQSNREKYISLVGLPPIVEATPDTLTSVLRQLVEDEEYRKAESDRILGTVQRVHGQAAVVERLEAIYDKTIEEFTE
jgi:glycosyltransferase involved in cell wall biosynthesis